jgi:hypothetical protein
VRRLSDRVQFKFEACDQYVKKTPNLKDKDIKFSFDEWSPRNRAAADEGWAALRQLWLRNRWRPRRAYTSIRRGGPAGRPCSDLPQTATI